MMHRALDSLVNTGQGDAGSVEKLLHMSELLDDLLLRSRTFSGKPGPLLTVRWNVLKQLPT